MDAPQFLHPPIEKHPHIEKELHALSSEIESVFCYGGTSLIRNRLPLGTYSSMSLGPYDGPRGGGGAISYERGTPVWAGGDRVLDRHGLLALCGPTKLTMPQIVHSSCPSSY